METEDEHNDDAKEWIRVEPGATRSGTIRRLYAAVDQFYTAGPDDRVQGEGDKVDEDIDSGTDLSIGASLDAGETDRVEGSDTDDSGQSDPPIKLGGETPDEGASGDTDISPEQAGDTDVEQTSVERTEPESGPGSSEYESFRFHFAPAQHSRGTIEY
jgi:hypothetical protein